ncbi:MAG TPA: hypothetical protein VHC70_00890 [Phycisphaerales bacterium]|nr:hypothetical protein [Phycisphaerales bacterium]
MLILNPDIVRFGSHAWSDVSLIAIDRSARRLIEDQADAGPFATFVDVPEQSITIRVQRTLAATDADDPALGDAGDLEFFFATPGAELERRRITIHCAVTGIRTDLPTGSRPAAKTIEFRAFSEDGSDPMSDETSPATEA